MSQPTTPQEFIPGDIVRVASGAEYKVAGVYAAGKFAGKLLVYPTGKGPQRKVNATDVTMVTPAARP